MAKHRPHETHPAIVKRLKRAEGGLQGVVEMLESCRSRVDIARRLHAVEKAVRQAKTILIQEHLDNCLEEAVSALPRKQRRPIDKFKEVTKYL
jgi:DNA-binding FrmR family transcriptional regulator